MFSLKKLDPAVGRTGTQLSMHSDSNNIENEKMCTYFNVVEVTIIIFRKS